jgi:hypothetical protein
MSTELKDRMDIIDLAVRYSTAASRLDARGIASVFTADGRLAGLTKLVGQPDVELVGSKAIAAFFEPIYGGAIELVHHLSQVTDLKIQGDRASATTMIVEFARPKGGGNMLFVLGEYLDDIARTPEGWRFSRRELKTKSFTSLHETPLG